MVWASIDAHPGVRYSGLAYAMSANAFLTAQRPPRRCAFQPAMRLALRSVLVLRRHVARRDVGTPAEEVTFHLLREILARARIGEAEAIFVDEHRLVLEPLRPG